MRYLTNAETILVSGGTSPAEAAMVGAGGVVGAAIGGALGKANGAEIGAGIGAAICTAGGAPEAAAFCGIIGAAVGAKYGDVVGQTGGAAVGAAIGQEIWNELFGDGGESFISYSDVTSASADFGVWDNIENMGDVALQDYLGSDIYENQFSGT